MANPLPRIVVFSDVHHSMDSRLEEEKWFPWACNFLLRFSQELFEIFLGYWDKITQRGINKCLHEAKSHGPYDLALGLGDYSPGYKESGMITAKSQREFLHFRKKLERSLPCPKILTWGDHDVGNKFGWSADLKLKPKDAGLTDESVEIAKELVGPPFGSYNVGQTKIIWLANNFITDDEEYAHLRMEQKDFLKKALSSNDKQVVVLIHDPKCLYGSEELELLRKHRQRIVAIFHGHMHMEIFRRFCLKSRGYVEFCREFPVHFVPATWKFVGAGGGFSVLNIFTDGSVRVESHTF